MPQAVIMAGGQGERFWPLTHPKFPKYRIRFDGRQSLLQATARRLERVYGKGNVHVVSTREHRPMIQAELPGLRASSLIVEPFRNNTASAIHFSTALMARRHGQGEVVSFFPADHLISDVPAFAVTMRGAIRLASAKPLLVTIGIKPAFPATGFGYILRGKAVPGHAGSYAVARFVEKPNREKARRYVRDGRYYWNGGIFTWRAATFLEAMRRHCPEIHDRFDLSNVASSYKKLPNVSIDYALMEKAGNIAVYRAAMDWCDMGNFDMFHDRSLRDVSDNFHTGTVLSHDCRDSFVLNEGGKPIVILGARGLVVVQTERGTLVCPRGRAEEAALLFKNRK